MCLWILSHCNAVVCACRCMRLLCGQHTGSFRLGDPMFYTKDAWISSYQQHAAAAAYKLAPAHGARQRNSNGAAAYQGVHAQHGEAGTL